ncbi:MAG: hypothetical protein L0Y35_01545 [Flammeovirgaceae bacterium]|nr:hypothetical protein [Flammeovirgaceae bacterium]
MYLSEALAEDALIEARTAYEYPKGTGPIAVYQCDECGYYHLTSKGPINEKLSKYMADGKLNLQKEANRWLDKLKKR